MSFFAELKRRNVVRVGIAYVLMGWLLLQGADFAFDLVDAPNWVIQSLSIIVAIGLPIALFFAWAFELTPEGVKREHEVDRSQSIAHNTGQKLNYTIIVLLVLAVGYLLVDKFKGDEAPVTADVTEAPAEEADEPEADTVDRLSIAVLPFDNRSNREEDTFFVEGIHDDLLTTIAKIGSMKVISRTSVMEYQDTTKKIPEIAGELGVANILEGGIQRSGEQVRINVQLIDAETDEHLWAEIYDRKLTAENLFAIQSEISKAIADALQATLTPEEQQKIDQQPTQNLAAYNAYLRGRQAMSRRTSESLNTAKEEFQRASDLDPEFALAWVGLADAQLLLYNYSTLSMDDVIQFVEPVLERALELDPNLGEAYPTLGSIRAMAERFEEAEAAYRKGTELSPNYATAWHWYSNYLRSRPDRFREALVLGEKALELDPLSSIIRSNLAMIYQALGDNAAAEARLKEVLDLDPDFPQSYNSLSGIYRGQSRFDDAYRWSLEAARIDPGSIGPLADQFNLLMTVGSMDRAQDMLDRIETLDAQHEFAYYANMQRLLARGNTAGLLELAGQIQLTQSGPGTRYLKGMMFAYAGEYEQARALMVYPGADYSDRDSWDELMISYGTDACDVAWLYLNTGDEALARDLIERTIRYVDVELPQYTDAAEQQTLIGCHAATGNTQAAIDSLAKRVASRRPIRMFWLKSWPALATLNTEPRFIELVKELEDRAESQREAVEQLHDAFYGAGP